ncbi:hypothetical protein CGZ69_04070 [Streptomyces peucetius subsp. caesius ATCC 27952]|nr:hypothetical protein CGZ69_04070 [Streptomyces peucetius subsp. caesius ATCC 27952]
MNSTAQQPAPEGAAVTVDVDRSDAHYRGWLKEAVRKVQADANRSADTHLLRFPLPEVWGIDLYLKDESTHPTGSLKHRLARSLFLYGLCNGWIRPGKPVIEASSGSTAVSEAYFAKLIGVPFVAVMPRTTSAEKIRLIEFHGGRCHFVDDPRKMYEESAALAERTGGHYMDQFTYAERATDWRGNNNIAESIYQQLRLERYPEPAWIVATAGTGGTSATIARLCALHAARHPGLRPRPRGTPSFFDGWTHGDPGASSDCGSRIEGIGRPRMEPSFVPGAIDRMMKVPDAGSVATLRALNGAIGRKAGGSHRHRAVERAEDRLGDGGGRGEGERRHADLRSGRPLSRQVLLRHLARRAGAGHPAVHGGDRAVPRAGRLALLTAGAAGRSEPGGAGEATVQIAHGVAEGTAEPRAAEPQREPQRRRTVGHERPPHACAAPRRGDPPLLQQGAQTRGVGLVDAVGVAGVRLPREDRLGEHRATLEPDLTARAVVHGPGGGHRGEPAGPAGDIVRERRVQRLR